MKAMPKSEISMLIRVENCCRIEPAESVVAQRAKVKSRSTTRTRPLKPGSAAR